MPSKKPRIENASHSVKEEGVERFDVIQQNDDPTRFILVEVYKTDKASFAHKETAHYLKWRDAVADMMAEPRQGIKYTIFILMIRDGKSLALLLRGLSPRRA